MVEGVSRLFHSDFTDPVNIGTRHEITMSEFADIVNEVSGNMAGTVYKKELRIEGDPQTRQPDTTRAKQVLDWEPQVSLPDGLAKTIKYFRHVTSE